MLWLRGSGALNSKMDGAVENMIDLCSAKVDVIGSILSPAELAKINRESERLIVITESNSLRISKLEALHNGKHPSQ